MASPDLATNEGLVARIQSITSTTASPKRAAAYVAVLNELFAIPRSKLPCSALPLLTVSYLDNTALAITNSSGGGLVVGRQVVEDFAKAVEDAAAGAGKGKAAEASGSMDVDVNEDDPSLPAILDLETRRDVVQRAVDNLQSRASIFEEQITTLRFYLCALLESEEDWLEAARALQGINLEGTNRSINDFVRLDTYIRIARLYLESDDPVQADVFLKRASHHIGVANEAAQGEGAAANPEQQSKAKVLMLSYKLCQARIYDAQRKFIEAATRFHELSYVAEIDEEERIQMLSAAVTASILGPAGPQRSRILNALIKDERTNQLPQRTILSKVFLDHIVRPSEIAEFEKLLAPHQTAAIVPSTNDKAMFALADQEAAVQGSKGDVRHGPSTVLDRAMMEHNVLAASRLYTNLTLSGLGSFLGVSPLGAETIARRMIQQRRLAAEIDQTAGLLLFQEEAKAAASLGDSKSEMTSNVAAAAAAASVEKEASGTGGEEDEIDPDAVFTKRWDAHIARTAGRLEDVYQRLLKAESSSAIPAKAS